MPTVNLARERSLYKAFSEQSVKARQKELAQLQEQLGTGRRINRASDDALGFARARQFELLEDRYAQYERSITSARTWVDHTQSAIDRMSELFAQAYEMGVRFANGTHSADDRQAAVSELESILSSVVDELNSKAGGEYLFAGSRTTVQPFAQAGNAVTYQGNDGGRQRHIGRDVSLNINISGERLFQINAGTTIADALNTLMTAVGSGDPAGMDAALAGIEQARTHVVNMGSEAGNIGKRLQMAETHLTDAAYLAAAQRSELQDVDMAEAMMQYQQAQTGLQAALRVASTVLETTILDYLR